jgi:EAL domain-containing protein (putative c-di-GMP-specific phosphodiesterase class I)/GGDEF domain-containing protein/PAS domain-containing protein
MMNVDELLRRTAEVPVTRFDEAVIRRNLGRVHTLMWSGPGSSAAAEDELSLDDPLRPDEDEADRIARAGQLIGMGTFTWSPALGRLAWSPKMSEILGYHQGFANSSRAALVERIHPADRDAFWAAVEETFESCNLQDIVMRVVRPQSATRYVRFYMQVLTHEGGAPRGVIATAQDVSDKVFAEKEAERLKQRCETILTRLEEHDPVTTLLNWRGFDNEVDRARRIGPGAVLLLRIEAVGGRPDQDGPVSWEEFMRVVADFLRRLKQVGDEVACLGENEFAFLLCGPEAEAKAHAVIADLDDRNFLAGGHRVQISVHGGLVAFDGSRRDRAGREESVGGLLIDADVALYEARRSGRPLGVVDPAVQAAPGGRQESWRARVRSALEEGRMTLFAQPLSRLHDGQVTRYELLLRLVDGEDLVTPAKFVAMAESLGMVDRVDLWVIKEAVKLLAHLDAGIRLQVNLSARSLGDPALLAAIEKLLEPPSVDASRLTFEITETAMIGNTADTRHFVDRLRALGCQFALDDFGSGYGSLINLKSLPFDILKIDGEFVHDSMENKTSRAMIEAIVHMCKGLGILSQAEFVEDKQLLTWLADLGVDFAQGYAVGRPRPVEELLAPEQSGTAPAEGKPRGELHQSA